MRVYHRPYENTVRMWFLKKPVIIKNDTKFRVNTFGLNTFNEHVM